jgi:hypothetical protein
MAALAAVVMPLILLSLGGAQWIVLRRQVHRAWRWIVWNVAAWAAGLPVSIGVISAAPNGSPVLVFVVAGVVAGALMGLVVACVIGYGMRHMLRSARPIPSVA